ncbi:MAG TPA: hypothetical protein VIN59_00320 [Alphaproteobacteria bacterium]
MAGKTISPLSKNWRKNVPPAHIIHQRQEQERQRRDDARPALHAPRPQDYAGYENYIREQQEDRRPKEDEGGGSWTFDMSAPGLRL